MKAICKLMATPRSTWRIEAEEMLRGAALTLRCGPVPSAWRDALPKPIGKARQACPAKLPVDALDQLRRVMTVLAVGQITDLQREILWLRAFDISWKEIRAAHPALSVATLKRHHADALHSVSRYLIATKRKVLSHQQARRATL